MVRARDQTPFALSRNELADEPIDQFRAWFADAAAVDEMPEAMTLATVDDEGHPDARMVLLKGADDSGFRFFTNYEGTKARQLAGNPNAALVFHWPELHRQVRIRGRVERMGGEESDAYFATRDRDSQIGAWASLQSQPLASRESLESDRREAEAVFRDNSPIPRPDRWGGYLLRPRQVEFWQGRPARLHDRFRYSRQGSGWKVERLSP